MKTPAINRCVSVPLREILSLSILATVTCLSGCSTHEEQITYLDKNGDDRIDTESHHFTGAYDADWELIDTDFNGRFDKRVSYSYSVREESVDLPVPSGFELSTDKVVMKCPVGTPKR
jgi:hypothetical protein